MRALQTAVPTKTGQGPPTTTSIGLNVDAWSSIDLGSSHQPATSQSMGLNVGPVQQTSSLKSLADGTGVAADSAISIGAKLPPTVVVSSSLFATATGALDPSLILSNPQPTSINLASLGPPGPSILSSPQGIGTIIVSGFDSKPAQFE